MKLFMQRQKGVLVPTDEAGMRVMAKIKQGAIVTVEVRQSRNIQHHRLYWALVHKVHENLPEDRARLYPTPGTLHEAIKVSVGLRTEFTMANGQVVFIPGSIAFEKFDQLQFSEFYDRVCTAIAKYFIPGIDEESLRAEVLEMIGGRIAA